VIRGFRPEDAEAAAGLVRAVDPEAVMTAALVLHWLEGQPARARPRYWIAEEGGDVVGWARARLDWATSEPGLASFWGCVRPDRTGMGIGTALLAEVERHLAELDARKLRTWAADEPAERFLAHRGFAATGRERKSVLDVAAASPREPSVPAGFRIATLRAVIDRQQELHALYTGTLVDVPMEARENNVPFDDWVREMLGSPALDLDGSFVVLAGERPVAFSWLETDHERGLAANEMTGTLPDFRRRGLARAAKIATIEWARDAGISEIWTTNDEPNAAMLALNDQLGYRATGWEVGYSRSAD
jgi:GNAT superfamily N-acetyltransferase